MRNARTHSDEQIAQIMASIAEFGFVNPILIDQHQGIIAGHGRLLAAQRLGMKEVPAINIGAFKRETQKRALIIADNRIAMNAGWDEEMLRLELTDLQAEDFNLDIMGFSEDRLDKLLAPMTGRATEDDAVPEVEAVPSSKPGDLWLNRFAPLALRRFHQTGCGGARAGWQSCRHGIYRPTLQCKLRRHRKGQNAREQAHHQNDNLGAEFEEFLLGLHQFRRQTCKGAIYIYMSSSELDTLQSAFRKAGGHWSTFIIWAKNNATMGRADCSASTDADPLWLERRHRAFLVRCAVERCGF
ncbi:MAG: ParB N-terminal domain-containing protein [Rickettsiales bacterium]